MSSFMAKAEEPIEHAKVNTYPLWNEKSSRAYHILNSRHTVDENSSKVIRQVTIRR